MLLSILIALAGLSSSAYAQTKGFNYGAVNTDNSPVTLSQFQNLFTTAQNLVGTSGFASARLFTTIQAGTINTPTEAIQAAINTKTSLLLGLWGSGGQTTIDNELAALSTAISQYGSAFLDLIVAVSVGSEDLYRISPTGIENMSNVGAGPDVISNYISQVRSALATTAASSKLIGHVDTWTAWVNGSNAAVISASDFIGVDAYPYFQNTMENSISNGESLFFEAYDVTVNVAGGKPVWVTETGWPVSGPTENLAEANTDNARTYWDAVGCGRLFGQVNTWWYTLQDAFPTAPSPSFGIVGTTLSNNPLFDLSCSGVSQSSPNAAGGASSIDSSEAVSAQAGAIGVDQKIGTGDVATGEAAGEASASSVSVDSTVSSATPVESASAVASASVATPPSMTSSAVLEPTTPTTLITKTSILSGASEATATASSCPANLSGTYEFPHLIVPVDKAQPDSAKGTSYNGTISSTISSIFNFDIPSSDAGKTCTLVFLLPTQSELTTSAFGLSGSGGLDVAELVSPATEQTTYNSVPSVAKQLGGPASVAAGNEYVIASESCAAGSRVGYEVSATGDLSLDYFQDSNPASIGFYVTVC